MQTLIALSRHLRVWRRHERAAELLSPKLEVYLRRVRITDYEDSHGDISRMDNRARVLRPFYRRVDARMSELECENDYTGRIDSVGRNRNDSRDCRHTLERNFNQLFVHHQRRPRHAQRPSTV